MRNDLLSTAPDNATVAVNNDAPSPPLVPHAAVVTLTHQSDFDTNGILHWIGTKGGTRDYQNRISCRCDDQNAVAAQASSAAGGAGQVLSPAGKASARYGAYACAWGGTDFVASFMSLFDYRLGYRSGYGYSYISWSTSWHTIVGGICSLVGTLLCIIAGSAAYGGRCFCNDKRRANRAVSVHAPERACLCNSAPHVT